MPPRRGVVIPELDTLRKLRDVLARGGFRAAAARAPEDHARIALFETIAAVLRLLDQFKRRVESGEPCGLRWVRHDSIPDRIVIEIAIEVFHLQGEG
jgi:uncharacterized membrane protein YccC